MNRSSLRWYYGGFIGILIAVLAFQLIWLPAPLVMQPQLEWISVVDWLYYGLLLIPACWLIGAWQTLRMKRASLHAAGTSEKRSWMALLPALLIVAVSIVLIILLLNPLQYLQADLALLAVLLLLVGFELLRSRLALKKLLAMFAGYAVALLLLLCPTGYQVTYPAMTMNMNQYAQFTEATASEQQGWIDGVLVFDRPAFPIDWLYAKLLPQVELRKQAADEPGIRETYSQVVQMKNDANQLAAATAWEHAGKGKAILFDGVGVIAVVADSPADGVIYAGDIIESVDNHTIVNHLALQQYMNSQIKPGDQVEIELRRAEQLVTVKLETIAADDDPARPILGIIIQDAYHIELPQGIALSSYLLHAGGPSHGAMLTLALLDQLTAGDITGGLHVAGTGTIEVDGRVGMVGGIPQKAYAVSRTDADVFFVPLEGEAAARAAAPQLNVVAVETFEDIVKWLEQHAPPQAQ